MDESDRIESSIGKSFDIILKNYISVKEYNKSKDKDKNRSKEQNRIILDALASAENDIREILTRNNPGLEISTNACSPIGNWPDVPWIAFGGPSVYSAEDAVFSLNINFQFRADLKGFYLVILPFAKGWKENYGRSWLRSFEPYRQEFRNRISWIQGNGFKLDDSADLASNSSPGSEMRDGYICFKFYSSSSMPSEEEFQRDLITVSRAHRELIESSEGSERYQIWGIPLINDPSYTLDEDKQRERWDQYQIVSVGWKGLEDLTNKQLLKLLAREMLKKDFVRIAQESGLTPGQTDFLWRFNCRIKSGDRVLAIDGYNHIFAEGPVRSDATIDPTTKLFWRRIEWNAVNPPKEIPSDLLGKILRW